MIVEPSLLAAVRLVVLLGVAAVLIYTYVRYRHNVLQGPAFGLMVGAALVLGLSLLGEIADLAPVATEAAQLAAAGLYLGATWEFAREFVDFGPEPDEDVAPPELDLTAEGGGFEDD